MIKDKVKLIYLSDLEGSNHGFEYKNTIFVFDTDEELEIWLEECSTDDLDYIIENDTESE